MLQQHNHDMTDIGSANVVDVVAAEQLAPPVSSASAVSCLINELEHLPYFAAILGCTATAMHVDMLTLPCFCHATLLPPQLLFQPRSHAAEQAFIFFTCRI
jgi:hypothetical protein